MLQQPPASRHDLVIASAETFGDHLAEHRRGLFVHCYRMMGTLDEAEASLQETLARAWQSRDTFRRSISFRARRPKLIGRAASGLDCRAVSQDSGHDGRSRSHT